MVLIEHRKLNDHSIEVEAPHLASPQRHCEFSTLKEFHCATFMGRCQFEEQTSGHQRDPPMSAFVGKAEITRTCTDVCF
jgi:hypothetical protein